MNRTIIHILITVFFTLLLHVACEAQSIDNFAGTVKINGTIELGDSPQSIVSVFGQPNNTETVFWEMIEKNGTTYHYNGAEFDFVDNKLRSFIFRSSNYQIHLGSFILKVGNQINTLSTPFPNSYSSRSPQGTSVSLGTGDYQYLSIGIASNGVITEIELRFVP